MLKRQSPYLIYLRLPKFSKSPMKAMQYLLNANIFTVREITVADTASIDLDTTSFPFPDSNPRAAQKLENKTTKTLFT